MIINILYFAFFGDLAGRTNESLSLPEKSTLQDLSNLLAQRDRKLADLLTYGRASVNAEWGHTDTELHDGDEVAFMPPMSGG
jgi:molybdopterin converting factor subunit 1